MIVLLMGGIGNRLFQIARAWDLKQAGHDPILVSVEALPEIDFLAGKLLGWTRHKLWIDTDSLAERLGISRRPITLSERISVYAELARSRLWGQRERFNLPLSQDRRDVQMGYFQGPGCISAASVQTVSQSLAGLLPLSTHPRYQAVIHVRGGDFAEEDRLSAASVGAFQDHTDQACVCVTNDPSYVRSNFPTLRLAPTGGPVDDFMTLCHATLIMPSNSTFCFWGCAIAVSHSEATLWKMPQDAYWRLLTDPRDPT